MMEEIITWEKISSIHREEKTSQKLQKLEPQLFEKVQEYIAKKEALGRDQNEIENIKRKVEELVNIRLKKIITFSTYGTQIENLTTKEKEIFEKITHMLNDYKSHITSLKPEIKREDLKEEPVVLEKVAVSLKPGKVMIRMLDTIPDFVNLDMKTYSLRSGDLVTIHKEVADVLVKKGKAELVTIE